MRNDWTGNDESNGPLRWCRVCELISIQA